MRHKFILFRLFLFLNFLLFNQSIFASTPCKVTALQCEYLVNPLGIDATLPRFTWQLTDARQGAKQTAYQILVNTDSLALTKGIGKDWNTGKKSASQTLVSYQGKSLQAFTKYYWRVIAWDKDGQQISSEIASFETGMMNMSNWQGAWISDSRDVNTKPAPYFRKTFHANKKIVSARAYIAVAGLYELYINGEKISNHRLDPMYTRFDRRTLYVTHDVTKQLQSGKNAIGVLLGNGWYNHQSTAVWYFHEAPWRGRPTFCMDIRVKYDDGTSEVIASGKDWKTALSPIIFNSIYTAEHYDARLEQPDWNKANFDDKQWKDVIFRTAPSNNIVAQALQPIRNVEEITTKSLNKINDTTYVFDLGRNISGVSKIKVSGKVGTVLRLKHAERLYPDGRADLSNIDVHYRPTDNKDPFQVDIITLSGKGEESFMPHFNYKGFQYVEITSSQPIALTKESLVGYFMHSDVPVVGKINSSNPTINKIWSATNNAYLSNLFGYPTDCPQREKNGWTGDAHIASETGLYNFDGITIYEKWLADHRDEQQANGVLPSIIPTDGWGYEWGNGPDWTSTIAIIPWNIYLFYGDTKILSDNYENLKRYVNHIESISPTGLTTWGLGDWVPVKSKTPVELTSSAYYFVDVTILAKTAKLFGKTADYERYSALADKIKTAFNNKYLNKATGIYGNGVQTELSVPLYWGLVPEELKAKVAANLAKRVEADNNHLDVGLLGTKAILNALSENGYADVAYKVASQETFPSWGWWIANGATTLYENWPIDAKSDISMNHIMFGEIGAWLYKGIGGIKPDASQAGFKNIILAPNFVENLNQFEASHDAPQGKIVSSWKRVGTKILYDITIPANASATILLTVSKAQHIQKHYTVEEKVVSDTHKQLKINTLTAGSYQFEIQ
ncbi:family 78 glycoside hydrolase catalytic domain [Arcicella aquatica]|uniref:alpha-L-rhamnosidase n=1 Tax=Arcicella aquatica TaxID=217141 RepID=A0ABU5QQR1_9BACT|nr:family 78 glycoside hydrolase catalytic domain [Arcicella aquatica]MEA5259024.1 family 78 glycoside hydrolase catalytic domain [Arcicella aquatica]